MTITDFILMTILIVIVFGLFKLMNANITIVYKQEFSDEDRQLLEDLYNNEGDPKSQYNVDKAFDSLIKSVNDLMLDNDEEAK